MKRTLSILVLLGANLPSRAQTHKVSKPEQVVRAVGVYEWTGDLKKPNASRLVPVTVFIDGQIQDAAIYKPRPIPFALTPGNEYELQDAGITRASLDVAYASHLQTPDSTYEDGWFGYGSYKAPPPERKAAPLHASRTPAVLTSSRDDAHPTLGKKEDPTDSAHPDSKPDTPSDDAGNASREKISDGSDTASANDPDSNNPERPTLRRRSPEDEKKRKKAKDVATVTGVGSLNDDPDRPKLHHGAHSDANDTDIPKLVGVPKDLRQMVAVSDAANRAPHDFSRPWQDAAERATILARMQSLARAELQAYNANAARAKSTPSATASPASAPTRRGGRGASGGSTRLLRKSPSPTDPSAETALLDEDLKAYILSYGGAPTYIYTARTAGAGANLRHVTVVAQADITGTVQPAIRNVTDDAHLDRTPQMRFIDVVDVEASNRASLLFDLRSQSTRQFALYRVIGSRADTVFTTGTTQ